MFARVQVPARAPYEALLVPDVAIGTEQVRKFVYVVGPDNTVSQKFRHARPARATTCASSRTGFSADDRVIVNGMMRARPGRR